MGAEMAKEPSAATCDALVAHLVTALGSGYTVRVGWPEHNVALDLSVPVIAVHPSPWQSQERTAEAIRHTDNGDGTTTSLYAYGRTWGQLQIDIWAPYRARRDETAALVEAALNGDRFPQRVGLLLTLSNYHSITAALDRTGPGRNEDDTETAGRGEWRRTVMVRAECALVAEVTEPTTTLAGAEIDVDDGTLTDTVEVTP
jgi:hypothetical protein